MKKLVWIVITLVLFDCTKEDFKPGTEEKCRVGRYIYGQASGVDKSYFINYNEDTLTRVDLVTDQIQAGDTWATNATYKHIYRNDSLYIKNFFAFKEGDTYLRAQLNERIQQVITTFPDNAGTYRYTFDYAKDNQITVTLDRMDGNTATFDSRGVYYLDALSDVIKLEVTRNPDLHEDDPDNFTSRTWTFTYDIVINPLKDFVLPHFLKPELPGITYFSVNNRLTETVDGTTKNYAFEYGTDPMPNKVTKPDGVVEKFEYFNCTN